MIDYIIRQDAINAVDSRFSKSLAKQQALSCIQSVPSAVVHCNNCIHYTSTILRKEPDGSTRLALACNKGINADNPDFYCGWGKSR